MHSVVPVSSESGGRLCGGRLIIPSRRHRETYSSWTPPFPSPSHSAFLPVRCRCRIARVQSVCCCRVGRVRGRERRRRCRTTNAAVCVRVRRGTVRKCRVRAWMTWAAFHLRWRWAPPCPPSSRPPQQQQPASSQQPEPRELEGGKQRRTINTRVNLLVFCTPPCAISCCVLAADGYLASLPPSPRVGPSPPPPRAAGERFRRERT